MQIAKWGNSLAVRLPQSLVRNLGLKEGDNIELAVNEQHHSYTVQRTAKKPSLADGFKKLRKALSEDGQNDGIASLPRKNRDAELPGD